MAGVLRMLVLSTVCLGVLRGTPTLCAAPQTARRARPVSVWPAWSRAVLEPPSPARTTIPEQPIELDRSAFLPTELDPPFVYSRRVSVLPGMNQTRLTVSAAKLPIRFTETNAHSGETLLVDSGSTLLNAEVFSQRLEAYHFSVSSMTRRLDAQQDWDRTSLTTVLHQLEQLVHARDLCLMYWPLLDAPVRQRLGPVRDVRPCLEQLRLHIFEAQVAAQIGDGDSELESNRTRTALRTLDRKASELLLRPDP